MIKSSIIWPFANYIAHQVRRERKSALGDQQRIFKELINHGRNTRFGKDHSFSSISSYHHFVDYVPLRDYEQLKKYFDLVAAGEPNVLWPGKPTYLSKTSGTTSGVKYIPITKDSMPNHIETARKALMTYAAQGKKARLFDGKVMFLSGSPTLTNTNGIPTGRLSGIVNHEIPAWLTANQLPSYETNCIEDWEQKVSRVVQETQRADLRLISGIPPWVQMYFEMILDATGKSKIIDVFPNLQVFIYGGVNYEPYRTSIEHLIGKSIDSIELYPASEGFIAFQDTLDTCGLLLNTNSGIFYEFVPLQEIGKPNPQRLTLESVELGVDYGVIINSNAGLWGYILGDLVRFDSLAPYRLSVSGRIKHFISAFGEHVIAKEIEQALVDASAGHGVSIREFTVAPEVNPAQGKPFHEWIIEFEKAPRDIEDFGQGLDESLRRQNIYYDDLVRGNILRSLVITSVPTGTFAAYMKSSGKLGGQNKVPRLSNDRALVDALLALVYPND